MSISIGKTEKCCYNEDSKIYIFFHFKEENKEARKNEPYIILERDQDLE